METNRAAAAVPGRAVHVPVPDDGATELRAKRDTQREGAEIAGTAAEWYDQAAKMVEPGSLVKLEIDPEGQVSLASMRGTDPASGAPHLLSVEDSGVLRRLLRDFAMGIAERETVSLVRPPRPM